MAGAREEYLAAGMDDYLSKPLEPEALFAALARLSPAEAPPADEPAETDEASAPPSDAVIFDPVRIATLKRLLPAEEITDFVRTFQKSLPGVTARVGSLLRDASFDELAQEAHALAGTAGNVGAMWLAQCARGLQHACKDGNADAVGQGAAAALRQALPMTQRELAQWLHAQNLVESLAVYREVGPKSPEAASAAPPRRLGETYVDLSPLRRNV